MVGAGAFPTAWRVAGGGSSVRGVMLIVKTSLPLSISILKAAAPIKLIGDSIHFEKGISLKSPGNRNRLYGIWTGDTGISWDSGTESGEHGTGGRGLERSGLRDVPSTGYKDETRLLTGPKWVRTREAILTESTKLTEEVRLRTGIGVHPEAIRVTVSFGGWLQGLHGKVHD